MEGKPSEVCYARLIDAKRNIEIGRPYKQVETDFKQKDEESIEVARFLASILTCPAGIFF